MELALLLVFLVFVELAFTIWFLARQRDYMKRMKRVEKNVTKLAEIIQDMSADDLDDAPTSAGLSAQSLQDLINTATPQDMAAAQAIISALHLDKE